MSVLLVAATNLDKCDPADLTSEQVDSFCKLYTRVIVDQGDGKIQAPLAVKKRLLTNEKLYRQACPQGA